MLQNLLPFLVRRPKSGVTLAISKYTEAAQRGVAPGAGSGGGLTISEEERRQILAEEQRQLDQLKVIAFSF